jgi:uncharacterized protein GlcG (DUF336 family)
MLSVTSVGRSNGSRTASRRPVLVHLLADGGVFVAVAHFDDALLQALDLLAQHFGLALLQAHGALAVRAGELHARQHLGMALEEAGCAQQVFGDVVFGDGGMALLVVMVRRECRSGLRTRSRRGR